MHHCYGLAHISVVYCSDPSWIWSSHVHCKWDRRCCYSVHQCNGYSHWRNTINHSNNGVCHSIWYVQTENMFYHCSTWKEVSGCLWLSLVYTMHKTSSNEEVNLEFHLLINALHAYEWIGFLVLNSHHVISIQTNLLFTALLSFHLQFLYFQLVKIIHLLLKFWHSLLLPVKYMWRSAYQMMQW